MKVESAEVADGLDVKWDDSQDIGFCGCVNSFSISRLRNVRGGAGLGGGR